MNEDVIKYLFTLPPEDIVAWFKAKGLRFTFNWYELWQESHHKYFTVAKAMREDILLALKLNTDLIFKKGISYQQFQKNLEPLLKHLGWWGKVRAGDMPGYDPASGIDPDTIVQLGSPHRLKKIYRINSSVEYNKNRFKAQIQNSVSRPYLLYVQLERATKRKSHEPFHGKVFMYNDPIWNYIYPPNGFECDCSVRALTEDELIQRGLIVSNGDDYMDLVDSAVPEEWRYNPGLTA